MMSIEQFFGAFYCKGEHGKGIVAGGQHGVNKDVSFFKG